MYTTILSDFSRVIIKPKDRNYTGGLNPVHRNLTEKLGQNYNPFEYFELNENLLNFYSSLKEEYSVNLFTTDIIQNHPSIRPRLESIFENIFAANDYGLNKKDPTAYSFIADKLGKRPKEIIYIDDQGENVTASQEAGMMALHYAGDDKEIMKQISLLLRK